MEAAQTVVNESYYLKQIIELKDEIIRLQNIIIKDKEIIKDLENKLRIQNNETKNTEIDTTKPIIPNKFDILEKEVIHKMDDLKACYYTIYFLQDGRLAAGGNSCSIIIYNKKTNKSEMTIKELSAYIMYLTQLKNGNFMSLGMIVTLIFINF